MAKANIKIMGVLIISLVIVIIALAIGRPNHAELEAFNETKFILEQQGWDTVEEEKTFHLPMKDLVLSDISIVEGTNGNFLANETKIRESILQTLRSTREEGGWEEAKNQM